MKITGQDFDALRVAIVETVMGIGVDRLAAHKEAIAADPRVKDAAKRYRWDVLFAVPVAIRSPLMNRLYQYANDEHIDTALRAILKD